MKCEEHWTSGALFWYTFDCGSPFSRQNGEPCSSRNTSISPWIYELTYCERSIKISFLQWMRLEWIEARLTGVELCFFHTWRHSEWWEAANMFQCIVLKLWSSKILTLFVLLHQTRGKGPQFPTKVGKLVPQVKLGDLSCLETENYINAVVVSLGCSNCNVWFHKWKQLPSTTGESREEHRFLHMMLLNKFLASSQNKDSHRFCFSDNLYAREDRTYGLHLCGAEVNFATLQLCMYMV